MIVQNQNDGKEKKSIIGAPLYLFTTLYLLAQKQSQPTLNAGPFKTVPVQTLLLLQQSSSSYFSEWKPAPVSY